MAKGEEGAHGRSQVEGWFSILVVLESAPRQPGNPALPPSLCDARRSGRQALGHVRHSLAVAPGPGDLLSPSFLVPLPCAKVKPARCLTRAARTRMRNYSHAAGSSQAGQGPARTGQVRPISFRVLSLQENRSRPRGAGTNAPAGLPRTSRPRSAAFGQRRQAGVLLSIWASGGA
jgi:hypothetical protein